MVAVVFVDARLFHFPNAFQRVHSRNLRFNNIRVIQHGVCGFYIEFQFVFGSKLESDYSGFAGKQHSKYRHGNY
jgi:hypothetical protein